MRYNMIDGRFIRNSLCSLCLYIMHELKVTLNLELNCRLLQSTTPSTNMFVVNNGSEAQSPAQQVVGTGFILNVG